MADVHHWRIVDSRLMLRSDDDWRSGSHWLAHRRWVGELAWDKLNCAGLRGPEPTYKASAIAESLR